MSETSEVASAWRSGRVPLVNAVSYPDGRMILLSVERHTAGVTVRPLAETDVKSFLGFNPGWWVEITPMTRVDLPYGDYFTAGEGSQGADGFIACCDREDNLRFSVFLDRANPFSRLSVDGTDRQLTAINNLGESWTLDIDSPWIVSVTATDDGVDSGAVGQMP